MSAVIERPPDIRIEEPDINDTVRSLLGDSYPDKLILLYMPRRVCHVFVAIDPDDNPPQNIFHWVLCFTQEENAIKWIESAMPRRRIGPHWRHEPVQMHYHPLPEACDLVKNLYHNFRGLLILQSDGKEVRHYVR